MKKTLLLLLMWSVYQASGQNCLQPESVQPIIIESDTNLCLGDCIDLHGYYQELRSTDSYTVVQLPYLNYPTYPYTGTQISVNIDDIYSSLLALPFSFCFFDVSYINTVVGSNGVLAFDPTLAGTFCAWNLQNLSGIPNANIDAPAIFGPYQDIDPSVYGQVYWQLTGAAPFRRFVASFKDIALFSSSCQTGFTPEKSQIILHENTNIIDIVIESKSSCSQWNNGLAIEGIQNGTATEAYVVPGRNNTVWTTTNEVYRFCPAGAVVPVTIEWLDDSGTLLGTGDSLHYCPPTLPKTVYFQATYLNCDTNFTLIDSIRLEGDSVVLNLEHDEEILDFPMDYFVEGCESIEYTLEHTDCNESDSVMVVPRVTGTVTAGADFTMPDTIWVVPYQNYQGVIYPIQDGVVEGFENATIYFEVPEYNDTLKSTMSFTLHDSIYINSLTYDDTKCPGETEVLEVEGADTLSYSWTPTTNLSSTSTKSTTATLLYPITYTVQADWKSCPSVSREFEIQVDTFSLEPTPGDTEVCYGEHILLSANPTLQYPNMTWNWTPSTGLSDPQLETTLLYPTADVSLVVTGTTVNGCVATGGMNVEVRDKEFLTLTETDFDGCPHDTFQLGASGAILYEWVPGTYLDDSTIADPVSSPITSVIYTLYGEDDLGCRDTATVDIELHPSAIIELGEDVTLHPSETIDLFAQGNCSFFSWSPSTGLSSDDISNPTASYTGQNITYVVTGATVFGCADLDTITVYSDDSLILTIPNAFQPGGNGNSSPTLDIIKRGEATLEYYRIFNRWGEMIFETADIEEGWDGTYQGEPQPIGTYVYDILAHDVAGRPIHIYGTTTLIK